MGNDQNQQDPFAQAAQPDLPVTRDATERIFSMGVRPGGSLEKALIQHHTERAAQAEMYRKVAADALGVLHTGDKPKNPQTGAYLTPDEIDKLTQQKDYAVQQYGKLVGVNKDAKGALEKAHGIIDFITGAKQRQAQMAAPPTPQYGTNVSDAGVSTSSPVGPPPTAGPTPQYASSVSDAGVTYDPRKAMTPPPQSPKDAARQAAYQQKLSALESSITAPFNQQGVRFNTGLEQGRRAEVSGVNTRRELVKQAGMDESKPYIQDFILTGKITGNMGAQLRPPPRPAGSYSTSVLDARSRAGKTGEIFYNIANEPIDLDNLDDSMGLKGMQSFNTDTGKWEIHYEPFSPNQSTVTAGNQVMAVNPMDKSKLTQGAGTVLGASKVPITATHTAPGVTLGGEIGPVTTSTTRTPQTPGVVGRQAIAPPPNAPTGAGPAAKGGAAGVGAVPQARSGGVKTAGPPKGNDQAIPFGAANQLNQRIIPVREAATQLFGDPTQPDLKGLADYAHLSEGKHEELANALRLTFSGLEDKEHSKGGLRELLGNYLGEPQALIDSQRTVLQDVIGKLSPEDQEAYNAEMTAIGTVMGLRALTKAGAYEFSVKALEREVPLIGLNTFSKQQFYDKMSRLAEQVYNGSRTVPMPKEEKEFYSNKIKEYRQMASGRKGSATPPPAPGQNKPSTFKEF